jgi:hypothetical protein
MIERIFCGSQGLRQNLFEGVPEGLRSKALGGETPVLRKNSMDDKDPSFECFACAVLHPGVSLVGTAV